MKLFFFSKFGSSCVLISSYFYLSSYPGAAVEHRWPGLIDVVGGAEWLGQVALPSRHDPRGCAGSPVRRVSPERPDLRGRVQLEDVARLRLPQAPGPEVIGI